MARVVVGVIFLLSVGFFIQNRFDLVMKQMTSKNPRPVFTTSHQDPRIKCLMCNGTGRTTFIGFGKPNPALHTCKTCNGAGYVDNPAWGK